MVIENVVGQRQDEASNEGLVLELRVEMATGGDVHRSSCYEALARLQVPVKLDELLSRPGST